MKKKGKQGLRWKQEQAVGEKRGREDRRVFFHPKRTILSHLGERDDWGLRMNEIFLWNPTNEITLYLLNISWDKTQGVSRAQFLKIIITDIYNAGKEGKI